MDLKPISNHATLRFSPGERVGLLTIIRALGSKHFRRGIAVVFECRCDCGNVIQRDRQSLIAAAKPSCGCDRKSLGTASAGSSTHPLKKCWRHMLERCFNPQNKSYRDYGARGITVCARWLNGEHGKTGFEHFVADMGPRPHLALTLERMNSDGHYDPSNCTWADRTRQAQNRRSTRILMIDGRAQVASAWAEEFGLPYFTLIARLNRGWEPSRAVKTPPLQSWDRHPAKG